MAMTARNVESKPQNVFRKEIWYVDFHDAKGSEQGGVRPGVVIQNDTGNKHSPTVIVLPITSKKLRKNLPTHVFLDKNITGLELDSTVLCEQIRTLDKRFLENKITELMDEGIIKNIERSLSVSCGLPNAL